MTGAAFGQFLAVLSAASFAAANLFIARTRTSRGDKGVMFSVLVTMGLSGALWLLLEAGRATDPARPGFWSGIAWFALAGVSAMVFGRSLVFESIRRLGVARATAVKRLNPFFSVVLAALFLPERISPLAAAGMVAIFASFALLIRQSLRHRTLRVKAPPPSAYLFGVGAALAYAVAYVMRKAGLVLLDAPAFGTFVSAVAGFAVFGALALVSPRYSGNFSGIFRNLDRWVVLAALLISAGQILLFGALAFESVSTVVMIASMEIFFAILLSVAVFRDEPVPGPAVLGAAGLAMAGVVLVAAG